MLELLIQLSQSSVWYPLLQLSNLYTVVHAEQLLPLAVYGVQELYVPFAPVDINVKLASHIVATGLQDKLVYPVSHPSVPFQHVTVHIVHVFGHISEAEEYTVKLPLCSIVCHWKGQLAGASGAQFAYP